MSSYTSSTTVNLESASSWDKLRVTELKDILRKIGLRVSGTKSELINQLIVYTRANPSSKDVLRHQWLHAFQNVEQSRRRSRGSSSSSPLPRTTRQGNHPDYNFTTRTNNNLIARLGPPQPSSFAFDPFSLHQQHRVSNGHYSASPTSATISPKESSQPLQFKLDPFYELIDRVIPPKIVDCRMNNGSFNFEFEINPEHSKSIADSLPNNPPHHRLVLFMANVDKRPYGPLPVEYPSNEMLEITLKVNDETIPRDKFAGSKKKPSTAKPADLSTFLKLRNTRKNKIDMIFAQSLKKFYACILLVKQVLIADLVQKAKNEKKKTKAKVLEERAKQIAQDKEDDIIAGPDVVSLLDPVSRARISCPARSKLCRHVQCFDLETYLLMNQNVPSWQCFVCNGKSHYDDIIVDELFSEFIKETNEEIEFVEVSPEGTWKVKEQKPIEDAPTDINASRKRKRVSQSPEIELIDDANRVEVIDLTLDTDGDNFSVLSLPRYLQSPIYSDSDRSYSPVSIDSSPQLRPRPVSENTLVIEPLVSASIRTNTLSAVATVPPTSNQPQTNSTANTTDTTNKDEHRAENPFTIRRTQRARPQAEQTEAMTVDRSKKTDSTALTSENKRMELDNIGAPKSSTGATSKNGNKFLGNNTISTGTNSNNKIDEQDIIEARKASENLLNSLFSTATPFPSNQPVITTATALLGSSTSVSTNGVEYSSSKGQEPNSNNNSNNSSSSVSKNITPATVSSRLNIATTSGATQSSEPKVSSSVSTASSLSTVPTTVGTVASSSSVPTAKTVDSNTQSKQRQSQSPQQPQNDSTPVLSPDYPQIRISSSSTSSKTNNNNITSTSTPALTATPVARSTSSTTNSNSSTNSPSGRPPISRIHFDIGSNNNVSNTKHSNSNNSTPTITVPTPTLLGSTNSASTSSWKVPIQPARHDEGLEFSFVTNRSAQKHNRPQPSHGPVLEKSQSVNHKPTHQNNNPVFVASAHRSVADQDDFSESDSDGIFADGYATERNGSSSLLLSKVAEERNQQQQVQQQRQEPQVSFEEGPAVQFRLERSPEILQYSSDLEEPGDGNISLPKEPEVHFVLRK